MNNYKQVSETFQALLWTAQVILSGFFIMTGVAHLWQPIDTLSEMAPWTADVNTLLVRVVGCFELLGGIGLLLPAMFRIRPLLTPWSSVCLSFMMLLAIIFHMIRGETDMIIIPLIAFLIALFIAWGRFVKAPVISKKKAEKGQNLMKVK